MPGARASSAAGAEELLPNFTKAHGSPEIPAEVGKITLAAEPPRMSAEGPTWLLRGSFRMPHAGGAGHSVLRRIVLALTSGASHVTRARHAFGEVVLFDGDAMWSGAEVTGYFNVNLADLFALTNRQETFHIVSSIDTSTSDVLTCKAEFPWNEAPQAGPPEAQDDREVEAPGEDEEDEDDEVEDDDSWMIDDDQESDT